MTFGSLMRISCVAALFITSSATAAVIDFQVNNPTGGSITFAGGASKLIGTNIDVDAIVGIGTPLNSDTPFACNQCKLRFDTGGHTGNWNFAGGGTIEIKGSAPAAGINTPNTVLLSGNFDSATVQDLGGNFFNFKIVAAGIQDTKHPDLLTYLGMPAVGYNGTLNLSFSTVMATPAVGGSFNSADVFSGNLANSPVPVPAAVWLFGSGLIGLIGIARRKGRV